MSSIEIINMISFILIINKIVVFKQVIEQFKAGRDRILGFAVGQVMKLAKGQANPGIVNKLVREEVEKR